jgi:hypothetical protein
VLSGESNAVSTLKRLFAAAVLGRAWKGQHNVVDKAVGPGWCLNLDKHLCLPQATRSCFRKQACGVLLHEGHHCPSAGLLPPNNAIQHII